jgi:hypothetical protein
MSEYRFQSGVKGRGLTFTRRAMYFSRALLGIPIFVRDFPAALGIRRTKSSKAIQFMNDICNSTNGSGLEMIDSFVKICKRSITKKFDSDVVPALKSKTKFSEDLINRVVGELGSDGFSIIRSGLPSEQIALLRDRLDEIPGSESTGKQYGKFENWLSEGVKPRFLLDQNMVGIAVNESSIDIDGLTLIARSYLGSKPHLLGPQCWYTKPTHNPTPLDLEEAAMAFHCDSDFFGFFKVFLLCTDVSEENGPFAFLKGSHKGKRHVQGRLSDEQLSIGHGERLLATGKAGDLFIVATKGWHKATPPTAGHRLMVQWLFSTGYFGSATN